MKPSFCLQGFTVSKSFFAKPQRVISDFDDKKVQVGKDQEKKTPTPKTKVGKKNKLTIRYLYHENIS